MDKRTSIMIADNSEEFCVSLSTALQRTERFNLVGTACDGSRRCSFWRSAGRTFWCWT